MDSTVIKNRRILVVDDNEAIHADFRKVLGVKAETTNLNELRAALLKPAENPCPASSRIRYEIESAFQGQEALAKVRESLEKKTPYALAFVDMRMPPGWDGLETIEQVWKDDPDIQVVICSAYSDYSWEEMVKRLGQTDNLLILKKPFDNAEISQLACALTEKWHLSRVARIQRADLETMVGARTSELRTTNEMLRDEVAQRQAAEDRLRHEAFHDKLTGLPNRALLMDRLTQSLGRAKRKSEQAVAVLFLDADNFKLINDSLGHQVGDELLNEFARRLQESVRSVDTVTRLGEYTTARLGGDEFVVLLEGIHGPRDAVLIAERIQERLAQPVQLNGHTVTISISIGIAVSQGDSDDAHELLRDADTAMYRAKHAGKARHAVFDESMHAQATARLELENALRSALEKKQFQVYYQPIIALDKGLTSGFEALLRWAHPRRGLVSPGEFIPVAEEIGLIVALGEWVLKEACSQLSLWNRSRSAGEPLSISINVSKKQLLEGDFSATVERVIRQTGIEPRLLNLEVTESAIIAGSDHVDRQLGRLKSLGVHLHMDDFGTGYSSLSCLHRSPFDVLKINRAFVKELELRRDYTAVIHAIITLAKNLGMAVTAEGVETKEQLAQILTLDCDYAQGYLFSKPVDACTATAMIRSNQRWLAQREPLELQSTGSLIQAPS